MAGFNQVLRSMYPASAITRSARQKIGGQMLQRAPTPPRLGSAAVGAVPLEKQAGQTWGSAASTVTSSPFGASQPLSQSKTPISQTPRGRADDPFWRDANGYGGRDPNNPDKNQDWYDTDYGDDFGEAQPAGEWLVFLNRNQLAGQDAKSNWARNLYSQARAGYDAARMSNPELRWRGYLKTLDGRLDALWAGMSPYQHGTEVPTSTKTIYMG